MNTPNDIGALEPKELRGLHDLARRRAQELRREAIGDFWRGADAVLTDTITSACRSAQRLGYRLARRAQGRPARAVASGEMVE